MAWWALWKLEPWLVLKSKLFHNDHGDAWDEPVDDEEAEEDDEGHGEEDGAVVNIFTQSKLSDQLKIIFYGIVIIGTNMKMNIVAKIKGCGRSLFPMGSSHICF